uniref:ATP synthase F0 subunit 8 n=1 Tax=Acanthogobius flavimanus TaxID=86203 RepID=UPI0020297D0E|nr:ATP synthase F0 subunit 8 [Acanthogobius flavimanus]UFH80645.1 ATP synthase F0 subunit 8 [Acanthogobius flavimanus]UPW99362.1 ATP synthase F0 subunit 8 [Acanthogobius flavimanus]
MPQLNPSPWFLILVFSWLVLLVLVVPKVMKFIYPNEATSQSTETSKSNNWTWPWQ